MPDAAASRRKAGPVAGWAVAVVLVLAAALCWRGSLTKDAFFMSLQGRDILSGGLHRDLDIWSCHEWMPFMHQKWAMCVLVDFILSNWGMAGARAAVYALYVMTGLAALAVSNSLWPGAGGRCRALPALALMALLCSNSMMSLRPHVAAGLFLLLELWCLEAHARGRASGPAMAAVMAACSMAVMWFHSTMWYECFIPVLPYLAGTGLSPAGVPQAKRRAWLLAAVAAMCLAGCLNPEGFGEIRYLALSASALDREKFWLVRELQPFFPHAIVIAPGATVMMWIGWMALSGWLVFRGRPCRSVTGMLFWAGSLAMMLYSVRLTFLSMLFTWFASMPGAQGRLYGSDAGRAARPAASLAVAALLVVQFFAVQAQLAPGAPASAWRSEDAYYAMLDEVDLAIREDSGGSSDVFSFLTDVLAYLEYKGHRGFMDMRAELFVAEGPDGMSPMDAMRDAAFGSSWDGAGMADGGAEAFLRHYGLDYVVVHPGFDTGVPFMDWVMAECREVWSGGDLVLYALE